MIKYVIIACLATCAVSIVAGNILLMIDAQKQRRKRWERHQEWMKEMEAWQHE